MKALIRRWFFATLADGSHMWVPVEMHGIADFAAIALQRLPPAVLQADDLARDALDELVASERVARATQYGFCPT